MTIQPEIGKNDQSPESPARQPLRYSPLSIIFILYAGCGLLLLPAFQFQINPDGICYLDIAKEYALGDFRNAVNGYWSPLISWLTAPFLAMGIPGQIAIKGVLLGAGGVALGGFWRLLTGLGVTDRERWWTTAAVVPMTLYFALWVITPDLLVTALLLWYFALTSDVNRPVTPRAGAAIGALGAAMYLAKAYTLPFFLLHFPLVILTRRLAREERRQEGFPAIAAALAVCLCTSGVWVLALKWKYDRFFISSVGPHARAWAMLPDGDTTQHGFFQPPAAGTSAWNDPTTIPVRDWSPFASKADFLLQLKTIFRNLERLAFQTLPSFSILGDAIPVALGIALFACRKRKDTLPGLSLLAIGLLLYSSGYLFLFIENRYFWVIAFLLAATVAVLSRLASGLPRTDAGKKTAQFVLAGVLLTFMYSPTLELTAGASGKSPDLSVSQNLYRGAGELRRVYGVSGRIASNANWHYSLYLAYFMKAQYLGTARPEASYDQIRNDLTRLKADYFFVWADEKGNFEPVPFGKEITGGSVAGLRIYRLSP